MKILLTCIFLIPTVLFGQLKTSLDVGAQLDAANRLRVSQQTTLGDYRQTNDKLPLYFDEEQSGTATDTSYYNSLKSGVYLAVQDSGDFVIRQTFQRHNYQSGKSHLIEFTFADFAPQDSVIKRVGYFESDTVTPFDSAYDGIWFESMDDNVYLVVKRGDSETPKLRVAQPDWNLQSYYINGASTINWDNFTVGVIDFLYLGGTRVRFGLIHNGVIVWVHEFNHVNEFAEPMIETPNLPIRYELRSIGLPGKLTHICSQVSSEGSLDDVGNPVSINNGTSFINASTVGQRYILLAVKLSQNHHDIVVEPLLMEALAATSDNFLLELYLNGTPSSALSFTSIESSALEYAAQDATTHSGGFKLASVYGTGNSSTDSFINASRKIGRAIDGTEDVLYLCVTPLSINLDIYGVLTIKELQ